MGKLFELDWYLDKAERDYLLLGKKQHFYKLRLKSNARANARRFEREIAVYPEISITSFSDRKIDGIKMGIPAEIKFDSDFLIKKRPSLVGVRNIFCEARSFGAQIDIDAFLRKHLTEAKRKSETLISAIKAAEYLLANAEQLKGLYPRQIPHGQSTKLLLNDTLVRRLLSFYFSSPQLSREQLCEFFDLKQKPSYFHFYANHVIYDGIQLKNHHSIITESSIHRFSFSPDQIVLIVENEETFHATHGSIPGVVIFGNGDKAANLKFLKTTFAKNKLYYWGDIDKAGYEILNNVCHVFPNVIQLGMDKGVIDQFWHLKQKVERFAPRVDIHVLAAEYQMVCSEGIQIEQEQLPASEITKPLLLNYRNDTANVKPDRDGFSISDGLR